MADHNQRLPGTNAIDPVEKQLGTWLSRQRRAYRKNSLDPAKIDRLNAMPGWTWNPLENSWEKTFTELVSWMADRNQRLPSHGSADPIERQLGSWVSSQRQAYRKNRLDPVRIDRLTTIPGWTWNPLDESWDETFTELVSWMADHNQRLPRTNAIDPIERQLAKWVSHQRTAYRKNRLDPARIDRLTTIPGWTWGSPRSR